MKLPEPNFSIANLIDKAVEEKQEVPSASRSLITRTSMRTLFMAHV